LPASGNGAAVAMCPMHTPALHQQPGSCMAWKDPNERIEALYRASATVVHPAPLPKANPKHMDLPCVPTKPM